MHQWPDHGDGSVVRPEWAALEGVVVVMGVAEEASVCPEGQAAPPPGHLRNLPTASSSRGSGASGLQAHQVWALTQFFSVSFL